MANEYKCDICGGIASVHITKIINGKKVKMHLCAECAEKASFKEMPFPPDIFPKIKELEESIKKSFSKSFDISVCPNCGSALDEMKKGSPFCCPEAYAILKNSIDDVLMQMHSSTSHKGKKPKVHPPQNSEETLKNIIGEIDFSAEISKLAEAPKAKPQPKPEISEMSEKAMKIELEKAVKEERYEDAATLRDELKKFSANQDAKKQTAK